MEYGWQMNNLSTKEKRSSKNDILENVIYQEMMNDYYHTELKKQVISKNQFKRAISHFEFSNYQEELNMILYFGSLVNHLDLDLPNPLLAKYDNQAVVNLATIYMRRKEPNDYPYFKKIIKCKDRIQFSSISPDYSFLGKSYFLDKNNYYILINSVNGIQDTVTLLHESSHVENYLKYGMNPSKFYAELPPITREHYSFDLLKVYDDSKEVEKQRNLALNHYLLRIIRLYHALSLFISLDKSQMSLKMFLSDFDKFSELIDISYLYTLLSESLEKEIGYALSFIASLDIYSNCTPKESNLFVTGYQIGTRKLNKNVIEHVVSYLLSTIGSYQKVKMI